MDFFEGADSQWLILSINLCSLFANLILAIAESSWAAIGRLVVLLIINGVYYGVILEKKMAVLNLIFLIVSILILLITVWPSSDWSSSEKKKE